MTRFSVIGRPEIIYELTERYLAPSTNTPYVTGRVAQRGDFAWVCVPAVQIVDRSPLIPRRQISFAEKRTIRPASRSYFVSAILGIILFISVWTVFIITAAYIL